MRIKKIISILIIASLMGLTIPSVFAVNTEDGISADAQICADIGILCGINATDGVTIAYTKTKPTRIQAAILILKLKGLKDAAFSYSGTKNFKDYKKTYKTGCRVMAYLKAHPSIGFVGYSNGYFYPNKLISTGQYYRLILATLGYKPGTDFVYSDVFKFAATKGLVKLNASTDFTIDALAVATVEGLRATLKSGVSTLIEKLVNSGVISSEIAVSTGLIPLYTSSSPSPSSTPTPSKTPSPTPSKTPTPTPTSTATPSTDPNAIFPLKLSSTGRYLTDINDKPYYLSIDTGWMVFSYIDRTDAEYYLENRRQHGINTILCYAAPFNMYRKNAYDEFAFLDDDLSTPNDAYFENVDWVINTAAEKDMQVLMCPFELANYTDSGYDFGMTVDKARAIGRYMGNRYKNFKNIIWSTGGDTEPDYDQTQITYALVEGIREYDTNHLISYHPHGGLSSSEFFQDEDWLSFNMSQCFSPDSPKAYTLPLNDYNICCPVTKPTILIEPPYEDGGTGGTNTSYQVRRALSWGSLSGTFGVCYGSGIVYNFGYNSGKAWKPYLDRPVFLQAENLVNCIKSREWTKLVPDQFQTLITSGSGNYGDLDYVATEIANDNSFSISYIPTSRAMTINMTNFNESKTLKWFDITNNTYTTIGTYPNTGSVNLAARPLNSLNQADWILVIE